MKRYDVILHVMVGGGGWGDPLERDPALVRTDVWNEMLGVDDARREYGVVIDPDTIEVDEEGTRLSRQRAATPC